MSRAFMTWRAHYGEHERLDPLMEWLHLAREKLATDEDCEIVVIYEPETNILRFLLGKMVPTDVVDPDAPYNLESISTISMSMQDEQW